MDSQINLNQNNNNKQLQNDTQEDSYRNLQIKSPDINKFNMTDQEEEQIIIDINKIPMITEKKNQIQENPLELDNVQIIDDQKDQEEILTSKNQQQKNEKIDLNDSEDIFSPQKNQRKSLNYQNKQGGVDKGGESSRSLLIKEQKYKENLDIYIEKDEIENNKSKNRRSSPHNNFNLSQKSSQQSTKGLINKNKSNIEQFQDNSQVGLVSFQNESTLKNNSKKKSQFNQQQFQQELQTEEQNSSEGHNGELEQQEQVKSDIFSNSQLRSSQRSKRKNQYNINKQQQFIKKNSTIQFSEQTPTLKQNQQNSDSDVKNNESQQQEKQKDGIIQNLEELDSDKKVEKKQKVGNLLNKLYSKKVEGSPKTGINQNILTGQVNNENIYQSRLNGFLGLKPGDDISQQLVKPQKKKMSIMDFQMFSNQNITSKANIELAIQHDYSKPQSKEIQSRFENYKTRRLSIRTLFNTKVGNFKIKKELELQMRISILLQIKKFIYKFKMQFSKRDFYMLEQRHVKMINDSSFYDLKKMQYQGKQQVKQNIVIKAFKKDALIDKLVAILVQFPTVMPNSKSKIILDVITIVVLIMTLWMYPIDLIMGNEDLYYLYGGRWLIFNCSVLFMFVGDIFLKFITGYFEKAIIITDKREIAQNYIKNGFLYDLIGIIPFICELIHLNYEFKAWNLLVFMKLPTLFTIINNVNDMVLTNKYLLNILTIFRLMLTVVFVAHMFGCIWWGFSKFQISYGISDTTWIQNQSYVSQDYWLSQYIWSFYFAVTTMTTVGYGDVTPTNSLESALLIAGMVIATGMFAYTFNSIGFIVEDLTRDYKEYKKNVSLMNIYLSKKNSPGDLRLSIHKYLESKYSSQKDLSKNEEIQLLELIPDEMQQRIDFESSMFIIDKNHSFFGEFSKKVKRRLAEKITSERVGKHDIIFEQNKKEDDPCFYFVNFGVVELYSEKKDSENNNCKHDEEEEEQNNNEDGDQQEQFILEDNQKKHAYLNYVTEQMSFGELSFFTNCVRSASARAKNNSMISKLKQSEFLEVLLSSPQDYQTYCMLRDRLIYSQNTVALNKECYGCKKFGHYVQNCPMIHYIPDVEKLILQNKFDLLKRNIVDVQRSVRRVKGHSLYIINMLKQTIEEFWEFENEDMSERNGSQQLIQKSSMDNINLIQENQVYGQNQNQRKLSIIGSQHSNENSPQKQGEQYQNLIGFSDKKNITNQDLQNQKLNNSDQKQPIISNRKNSSISISINTINDNSNNINSNVNKLQSRNRKQSLSNNTNQLSAQFQTQQNINNYIQQQIFQLQSQIQQLDSANNLNIIQNNNQIQQQIDIYQNYQQKINAPSFQNIGTASPLNQSNNNKQFMSQIRDNSQSLQSQIPLVLQKDDLQNYDTQQQQQNQNLTQQQQTQNNATLNLIKKRMNFSQSMISLAKLSKNVDKFKKVALENTLKHMTYYENQFWMEISKRENPKSIPEYPMHFTHYFQSHNFNPEEMVQQAENSKDSVLTPGFGRYTLFSRKIKKIEGYTNKAFKNKVLMKKLSKTEGNQNNQQKQQKVKKRMSKAFTSLKDTKEIDENKNLQQQQEFQKIDI